MAPFNPPFTIPPISTHTHTLILLHDRGGSGQDFGLDMLNATTSSGMLLQSIFPGMKFIFPNANSQCVTAIEGGPRMAQWFDVYSTIDPSEREALQVKGLREGAQYVHRTLDEEALTLPLENIFLGGFSQGSAMALFALLAYRPLNREGHLGGFVGLSGWLPLKKSLDGLLSDFSDKNQGEGGEASDVNTRISTLLRNQVGLPPVDASPPKLENICIFLGHGEADNEAPLDLARQTTDSFNDLGLNVISKTYDALGHAWRSGDQIDDVAAFLTARGAT